MSATALAVGRMAFGALPATLLVLGVVLITAVAMFLDGDRRTYALSVADKFEALARVIVGVGPPPEAPPTAPS